jgi:DUF1680 family protein
MRTLASLDGYLATTDPDGLQIHLYAPSTVTAGDIGVEVETGYPWDGVVRVRVTATPPGEWTLSLRVPGWASGATLTVAGERIEAGPGTYARIRRAWQTGDVAELTLPMPVRLATADERIDAVRGCVAIERGPLVYAVEEADGVPVDDLRLDPDAPLDAHHRPDLLDGVTVVTGRGTVARRDPHPWPYAGPAVSSETPAEITAVPYFAWANRGIGSMRVWLPRTSGGES